MEQEQVKAIEKFVSTQRKALIDDLKQQLGPYGISSDGTLLSEESLSHLPEHEARLARQLRQSLEHRATSTKRKSALAALVREQAFTILNRMVALRMAEARGVVPQTISQGMDSEGFGVYQLSLGSSGLPKFEWYREYIYALLDELSLELPALFDRFRQEGLLFPRQGVFLALIDAMNAPELEGVWEQDETLGWVYQYFNDPKERKKMREKGAPSDSYELAVRNQFFTPRYVVQFLVDNSLGRLWVEMTKDRSALSEQCSMLALSPDDELVPQVPREPRELRIMDPACGSMHFGLYAFDLLSSIYRDAWERSEEATWLSDFRADFENEAELLTAIPRLILEENLLGIDIDRRATQIAGLTLWLRAHRWWHEHGVAIAERPKLERLRLATAQPMPGEEQFFKEFTDSLHPPVLGELANALRKELTLAGTVGSLLKVEKTANREIEKARKAREKYQRDTGAQQGLFQEYHQEWLVEKFGTDIRGVDADWEELEVRLFDALREYAQEHTTDAQGYQHSLFADDTEAGLAFVDLLRMRYDVVLMNPPFGATAPEAQRYVSKRYPASKNDLYAAFVDSFIERLEQHGYLAAITSRTGFFLDQLSKWRTRIFLDVAEFCVYADLGSGVLEGATVDTAAYTLRKKRNTEVE